MGLKSDKWIRRMSLERQMIVPFAEEQVGRGVVSYGVSSYGYDIRGGGGVKNFTEKNVVDFKGGVCIVPPNSFALARTIEYFNMPDNVLAICLGKSTYARCGIIVNVTPFEPGFKGHITIEISNTTPLPAKIYANEGIAQVLFIEGDEPCEVTYADKKGKYQAQEGITLPRILK